MSEWHQAELREVATHIKDGTHGTHRRVESGLPFLSAKNIGSNGRLSWDKDDDLVSELDYAAITATFTPQLDDLLLTVVGSIGRSALFDGSKVAFQRSVAFVRCSNRVFPEFLFQASCSENFIRQLERRCNVTAQAGLYLGELAKVRIPLPPKSQQRKIAAILTSIDTAIEKTEALIAKYQQIKAGLMHDLFTRGVLPNGQLRPPRDQAPALYQETAIGWIPVEWAISNLEALLAPVPNNIRSGPFGSALLKQELVEDGIPFLGIDNIHVERFDADFHRFVSERKFRELARYKVRPGDVVITIMGTVGRCCVIPESLEIALSSKHLWTMTFDPEKVVPELVCWQLNHAAWSKAWFRRAMQGGIMDAIQSSTLKTLQLPLPSLREQAAIYARYQQVTGRIQRDAEQLEKLQKQKLGLMQDLLTGKVPVPVDAAETEACP